MVKFSELKVGDQFVSALYPNSIWEKIEENGVANAREIVQGGDSFYEWGFWTDNDPLERLTFKDLPVVSKFKLHNGQWIWEKKDCSGTVDTVDNQGPGYVGPDSIVRIIVDKETKKEEKAEMKFSDVKVGQKFKGLKAGGEHVWIKTEYDSENCGNAIIDGGNNTWPYGLWSDYDVVDEVFPLVVADEVSKEKVVKTFSAKIVGRDSVTVMIDGQMYSAGQSHLNYAKLREAVDDNDAEAFLASYEIIKADTLTGSGIEVKDDSVYFNGKVLHNTLCNRLLALVRAGKDASSMTKFLENLMQNPSAKAISELYDFLENKNLPITDDGHFLGYKTVGPNWYSKAAGKLTLLQGKDDGRGHVCNEVGQIIECPRNEVDDERDNECSYGLHVGGLLYSGVGGTYHSHGDKCLIVKVNPKDVIAVPRDYNAQKLRTCKYEVVSEFVGALNKPVYEAGDKYVTDNDYNEEGDYEYDDALSLYDLEEGDCIEFMYNGEERTAEILNIHSDIIHTKLLAPESDVGEYRNFTKSKMSEIYYV
jgi:hypothetical protein